MEIKILNKDKNSVEIEIESLTVAEILRVYLNKDSAVSFCAWKREHSTVNPVLAVKTQGKDIKAVVDNVVKSVMKDLDSTLDAFKKLK